MNQHGGSRRGGGLVKGVKHMMTKDDLALGGGHTKQNTDFASQKCTL